MGIGWFSVYHRYSSYRKTLGRKAPTWKNDLTGLCGGLSDSDEPKGKIEKITLIPMGAARLRISAFPASRE